MGFLTLLLFPLFAALLLRYLSGDGGRKSGDLPPGPRGWPVVGNLLQLGTRPHHTLHAMAKIHGPILRLRLGSVETVVASSAAAAEEFLRAHDGNFCNRPPNSGAEHVAYNYRDLVFAPYGPRWRALRKVCAVHLFSAKALEGLRDVREDEVWRLVRSLSKAGPCDAVKIGEAVNACVTNALARATVGRRVFGVEGEVSEFKEMVVELFRLAGVFNLGDFVPGLGWLDLQGVVGSMKRLHRRFDVMFDKIITEHQATEEAKGRDLLSVLLGMKKVDADVEGGELTDTEIKALLLNLFAAGTDTTSSTVEWALSELVRHPGILKQAQRELDSVVGPSRLVSESDLPNLPVLQAIVKETFRLHPSTPLSLPRIASEECEVGGYRIPKHATLLVNVWAIARDPSLWPDPLEFRPARFLPGGGCYHLDVRGNDFGVIPFGAGRRICVGLSLGLRMVQFMTATLVHSFDWALMEGQKAQKLDMEEAYGLALRRAVPLMVRPVPRLSEKAYM